jgi:hypothetical protein
VCLSGARDATLRGEMSRPDRRRGKSSVSPTRPKAKAIDAGERRLVNAVARGEWASIARLPIAHARYARFATATRRRLREP